MVILTIGLLLLVAAGVMTAGTIDSLRELVLGW